MKSDKFIKVVLTVIAINLTFLTAKNLDLIPKAYAKANVKDFVNTSNIKYGLVPINKDGSINVHVKTITSDNILDVNIEEVGGYNTYGEVPVEIKDQPIEVEQY